MKTILNYLKQPSTWQGIIILGGMIGVKLQPDQWQAITTIGVTLVGLILTFQNDTPAKP